MEKFSEIQQASTECVELPEDEESRKLSLARHLQEKGHQVVALGRALVTIERTERASESPPECADSELLKVSFYPDPDASGSEIPMCIYLSGSRDGLGGAWLRTRSPDGRERVFRMREELVRDDF